MGNNQRGSSPRRLVSPRVVLPKVVVLVGNNQRGSSPRRIVVQKVLSPG